MSEKVNHIASSSSGVYSGKLYEFFPLYKAGMLAKYGLSYMLNYHSCDKRLFLTSHCYNEVPVLKLTSKFLNVAQSAMFDIQNGVSPNDLSATQKSSIVVIQKIFQILNSSMKSHDDPSFEWFRDLKLYMPNTFWAFNSLLSNKVWNNTPQQPSYDLPHLDSRERLIEAYHFVLESPR